ncbi:MAG: class I SAM-dependent methyltransferase [Pirellulales bacterium]
MSENSLLSYDQIPYHSGPFRQTHPSHLAVLPTLFGMTPPRIRGARVLELGCASGGNLTPMAQSFPETQFVGVDLSARQVAEGREVVSKLGLKNIELRHASILDIDESFGEFEYVLCHGVYSWVPRPVQDKVLQIAAKNMVRGGVCYVSYNVYPGWHMRGVVRDMMQYHTAGFADPQTKIDQARLLLAFLNRSSSTSTQAYRQVLADEAKIVSQHSDSYLFHEHLEEVNEPLYFHQFVERVSAAGLAYLGDSNFSTMLTDRLDPEAAALLKNASILRQEQYMDFLRNRMFRCSVLCHQGLAIDRAVQASRLAACHVALDAKLELPATPALSDEPWEFPHRHERISVAHPATKSALESLNRIWPASAAFELLWSEVEEALIARGRETGQAIDADERNLARRTVLGDLMTLFARGLVIAWHDPPPLASVVSERPQATSLARLQAATSPLVTNQKHESARLGDLPRALVQQLDGTRSRADLRIWLEDVIARGQFRVLRDDQPVDGVDDETLDRILDALLTGLRATGLLAR